MLAVLAVSDQRVFSIYGQGTSSCERFIGGTIERQGEEKGAKYRFVRNGNY
jgi:hypothetical protein